MKKVLASTFAVACLVRTLQGQFKVNAFACTDGSVRVFTALMDLMTDAERLQI